MASKIVIGLVIAIVVVAGLLIWNGFFRGGNIIPVAPANHTATPINQTAGNVAEANNLFAFDLYSQYKSNEGNIFYSPYSISTAVAMVYEGAKGQTASEIAKVFYFPLDNEARRNGFKSQYENINQPNQAFKLSTANALWVEKTYSLSPDYLSITSQYYDGNITNLDFKTDSENSRIIINDWIEGKTNDKIKDLIPSGAVGESTRLVLTNAVYFLGNWTNKFTEEATSEQDFRITSSNIIKAQTMHQTNYFNYAEDKGMQALEMNYRGDKLSMIVLLPTASDTKALESLLTPEKLKDIRSKLSSNEVQVSLPKFKFETKYFMADTLKEMGMPTAFKGGIADFSGMSGSKDLYIGSVIHQAYVAIDEDGTEAAAATAVIMETTSIPPQDKPKPKIFKADHPFIFLIQDKETGTILFMGRVNNPNV